MFSFKKKLSPNLRHALDCKLFNKYRVIIKFKSLEKDLEKKIKYFKCEYLFSISMINCIVAILNPNSINRLIELPEVKYIILDDYAFLCGSPILSSNKIFFKSSNILNGDYKLSGKGVGIGVIDSGVYPHKDINHKIENFIDLLNGYKYPYDNNGHGTFISGVLCGNGSESKGRNRGIAENSTINMVKAFDEKGKAFISNTLHGIEMLINLSEEFNIKILCLPFEVYSISKEILELYSTMFKIALKKNMTIIVPSGSNINEEDSIRGISTLKEVITIGGLDNSKGFGIYKFSSCGSSKNLNKPDFIASCTNITSLNSDVNYISERNGAKVYPKKLENMYIDYSGTSVSCAYVAGICALLYEHNPNLNQNDIYGLLKLSSKLIKEKKYMQGNGCINFESLLPKKN